MHHMDADKAYWEKAKQELYQNGTRYIEPNLEATSNETVIVRLPFANL